MAYHKMDDDKIGFIVKALKVIVFCVSAILVICLAIASKLKVFFWQ